MTLKEFIFDKMEKQGYVLDYELAKFLGKEPNYYTAEIYKREWLNFQRDKERCVALENNPNTIIYKGRRKYLIRDKTWENFQWYKISKIYFEYLKNKGICVVNK